MSRFFFGMITGAVLLYVAMHYHVVRGQDGVFLVPKLAASLGGTYTDIREFTLGDWREHRSLAVAIHQSNRSQLIHETVRPLGAESIVSATSRLFAE